MTNDVFVPRIMLLNYKGQPATAAVWPDAIPSVMPPVDILLIGRQALAPRKFLRKAEDIAIGMWADFQPLLDRYKTKMHASAYYLFYDSVPKQIEKAVKSVAPYEGELEGLSYDQVLDRELVRKYVS